MPDGPAETKQPAPRVWETEAVEASWPAKCRRQAGYLLLTRSQMVHVPDGAGAAGATALAATDITKCRLAPRTDANSRAAVEISLHEVKVIVELTCSQKRWEHQSQVRDALTRLIRARASTPAPEAAAQTAADAVEKTKAAAEPPSSVSDEASEAALQLVLASKDLREQYAFLVEQTKAMSRSQFLAAHARELITRAPLPAQPGAVDLTVLRIGGDGRKGGLATAEEEALLEEFPAIAALYRVQVPAVLTREDFWRRCLRSRYYLTACGHEVPSGQRADPLFDSLEPSASASRGRAAAQTATAVDVDVSVDLAGEPSFERDSSGSKSLDCGLEGIASRRVGQAERLVTQLNERSARQLEALLARSGGAAAAHKRESAASASSPPCTKPAATSDADGDAALRETVDRRRRRLRDLATALDEDLGSAPSTKVPRLMLDHTVGMAMEKDRTESVARAHAPSGSAVQKMLQDWAAGAESSGDKTCGMRLNAQSLRVSVRAVLQSATEEIQHFDSIASSAADRKQRLPPDAVEVASRAQSLLQHFWASRLSEAPLRERLAAQLRKLAETLEAWEKDHSRARAQASSAAALRCSASRSLLPPIRKALGVHQDYLNAG